MCARLHQVIMVVMIFIVEVWAKINNVLQVHVTLHRSVLPREGQHQELVLHPLVFVAFSILHVGEQLQPTTPMR